MLADNLERGLHTLLLLDIRAEENRTLSANEAMRIMLELESKLEKKVFTPKTLAVVIARADSDDCLVKADKIEKLENQDFGPSPHVIIVPGKLHFMEVEALQVLAGAPKEVVNDD